MVSFMFFTIHKENFRMKKVIVLAVFLVLVSTMGHVC